MFTTARLALRAPVMGQAMVRSRAGVDRIPHVAAWGHLQLSSLAWSRVPLQRFPAMSGQLKFSTFQLQEGEPPKGPRNPYILFCMDKRPELKELKDPKEIMAKLAELWREVKEGKSEDSLEAYQEKAAQDKERFKRETAAWADKFGQEKLDEMTKQKRKKKAAPSSSSSSSKTKRFNSYTWFMKEQWEAGAVTEGINSDSAAAARAMWKGMSDEEKERYKTKAKEHNEQAKEAAAATDKADAPITD